MRHINIYDHYKSGPSLECKGLLHSMTVYNIVFIIVHVAWGKFSFATVFTHGRHRLLQET